MFPRKEDTNRSSWSGHTVEREKNDDCGGSGEWAELGGGDVVILSFFSVFFGFRCWHSTFLILTLIYKPPPYFFDAKNK